MINFNDINLALTPEEVVKAEEAIKTLDSPKLTEKLNEANLVACRLKLEFLSIRAKEIILKDFIKLIKEQLKINQGEKA